MYGSQSKGGISKPVLRSLKINWHKGVAFARKSKIRFSPCKTILRSGHVPVGAPAANGKGVTVPDVNLGAKLSLTPAHVPAVGTAQPLSA